MIGHRNVGTSTAEDTSTYLHASRKLMVYMGRAGSQAAYAWLGCPVSGYHSFGGEATTEEKNQCINLASNWYSVCEGEESYGHATAWAVHGYRFHMVTKASFWVASIRGGGGVGSLAFLVQRAPGISVSASHLTTPFASLLHMPCLHPKSS